MHRLQLCLPRCFEGSDIRQIERCINTLHVELLLSVLVAMLCSIISVLATPYPAYIISLPYMAISVSTRVLRASTMGNFQDVISLNNAYKVFGLGNIVFSVFSLVLCGIASGRDSGWLLIISLCFYTATLIFHIFIVSFAAKMYGVLRDNHIAICGRCMEQFHIPETHIDETYRERKLCQDPYSSEVSAEPFGQNPNNMTASPILNGADNTYSLANQPNEAWKRPRIAQHYELCTPMESSSACMSTTVQERCESTRVDNEKHDLWNGGPGQPSQDSENRAMVQGPSNAAPVHTATSPKRNCFPPFQNSIPTGLVPGFDTMDLFDRFERVNEEHPVEIPVTLPVGEETQLPPTAMTTSVRVGDNSERGSTIRPGRTCGRCTSGQVSTPIARYSELSPESDPAVL